MPEEPDDIDVVLRKYAAERKAFVAKVPELHAVDIRMLAEEARKGWKAPDAPREGMLARMKGMLEAFPPVRWATLGATAMVALFFAWSFAGNDSQKFPMAVEEYRGENDIPADYTQFSMELRPGKNQVILKFAGGASLQGTLRPAEAPPVQGEPVSYAVVASGVDAQNRPIAFKGSVIAVMDPAAPKRIKEVSLRGIITAEGREIPIAAARFRKK